MSSIRMCDKCGTIFSENEEDWSTGVATQFYTDEKGVRRQREQQRDQCGACNGTPQTIRPRLTIPEGTPDYAKIKQLEAEIKLDIPPYND